jgi:hypothetical protein
MASQYWNAKRTFTRLKENVEAARLNVERNFFNDAGDAANRSQKLMLAQAALREWLESEVGHFFIVRREYIRRTGQRKPGPKGIL